MKRIKIKNGILQTQKKFLGIKYWSDYIVKETFTITWVDGFPTTGGISSHYYNETVTFYKGDKIIPDELSRYQTVQSYNNLYKELKKHI